jgi:hypothetical protein
VRGALATIEGVSNIKTDIPSRRCTFKLDSESVDIQAKLAEISKTNEHVEGFQILRGIN